MDGVAELVAQNISQQQENGLPTTLEDARWQLRDLYLNFVHDQVRVCSLVVLSKSDFI